MEPYTPEERKTLLKFLARGLIELRNIRLYLVYNHDVREIPVSNFIDSIMGVVEQMGAQQIFSSDEKENVRLYKRSFKLLTKSLARLNKEYARENSELEKNLIGVRDYARERGYVYREHYGKVVGVENEP